MMEEWYSYSKIRYTKDEVIWLLRHISLLRDGVWPSNPTDSGYTGSPQGKRFNPEGKFVKAAIMAAELDWRIAQCKQDGYWLEQVYSSEDNLETMSRIAQAFQVDINELDYRIHRALRFSCGFRRKPYSYREFCQHRREHRKRRGE